MSHNGGGVPSSQTGVGDGSDAGEGCRLGHEDNLAADDRDTVPPVSTDTSRDGERVAVGIVVVSRGHPRSRSRPGTVTCGVITCIRRIVDRKHGDGDLGCVGQAVIVGDRIGEGIDPLKSASGV